ncbi:DNA ligase-like protein [Rhynchospora pubera]|uniref:DNA ligase-like protein n=1 Tax=Rhynchospora pubera TaxID=906938 RepID=A0AAV8BZR0_9POAL|nr:DNA ligase-like protein [Rhynchospora pubera]KAJ4798415.1 DNA ligase-like protein [Rhynchospora pubera]
MSSARANNKRTKESSEESFIDLGSDKMKKPRDDDLLDDLDADLDISSDIKGIISALHSIREKAQKDGQKKSEETIESVASEIRAMIDIPKSKADKDRQNFLKSLLKFSKECESSLKNEYSNLQAAYDRFSKDKAAALQSFKELFAKYEDEKEKLLAKYEQQRKKDKTTLSELEKACKEKITNAEETIKKKQQDDKSFSILRKSLGSFLDGGSDEDFGQD